MYLEKIKSHLKEQKEIIDISMGFIKVLELNELLIEELGEKYKLGQLDFSYCYNDFMLGMNECPIKIVSITLTLGLKQWDIRNLIKHENKELFQTLIHNTERLIDKTDGQDLKKNTLLWRENTKRKAFFNKESFNNLDKDYGEKNGILKVITIKDKTMKSWKSFFNSKYEDILEDLVKQEEKDTKENQYNKTEQFHSYLRNKL